MTRQAKSQSEAQRKFQAQILGTTAFKNGINASALDPAMTAMLKPKVGANIGILKAWIRGWTLANLNSN